MEIGITGLSGSGKSTVFNALARAHAQVGTFTAAQSEPNRAVVKVPDNRVDVLADIFKPKSVKPAEVQFVDVAGLARGAGLESAAAILGHVRTVDALLLVIGAFQESSPATALGDLASIETDFILSDLDIVDKRLDRLEREVRMARGDDAERQTKARELDVLRRLKTALDAEQPIRMLDLAPEEEKLLRGYALLTAKPALAVLNTGDDGVDSDMLQEVTAATADRRVEWIAIAGHLEMELAELDPKEADEFMEAMGVRELAAGRVIQASYRLLDLISFLTAGADEVRAWTIRRGSTAVDAAAAIHSDLARGFIRAEVVTYDDLVAAGSFPEARKRGKLRSEGKTYVVRDGDVINVLFNV
jgi:GTP-binding protein YchF